MKDLKGEPKADESKQKKKADHPKKDPSSKKPAKKTDDARAKHKPEKKDKGDKKPKIEKKKPKKDVTEDAPKEEESILKSKTPLVQPKAKFLVMPTPHWYTAAPPLAPIEGTVASPTVSQLSSLTEKAGSLHDADVLTYTSASATTSSISDARFLQTVLQTGTLSDRLSAMTLMVQGSPLHNIKALDNLKNMAERGKGKGGREESLKALRCIVDWWVGGGAPERKLK